MALKELLMEEIGGVLVMSLLEIFSVDINFTKALNFTQFCLGSISDGFSAT